MSTIDYSALGDGNEFGSQSGELIDIKSGKQDNRALLRIIKDTFGIMSIVIFLIGFIAAIIFNAPILMFAGFFAGATYLIIKNRFSAKNFAAYVHDFAIANNWQPEQGISKETIDAAYANTYIRIVKGLIAGELNGKQFWLAEVTKAESTVVVLIINTNSVMPQAVIIATEAMKSTGLLITQLMMKQFGDLSRVKMEGNFDQYFNVYAKPNQQIVILAVITPNVMQTLLSQGLVGLILFNDHYVTLEVYKDMNRLRLKTLFQYADLLSKQLR